MQSDLSTGMTILAAGSGGGIAELCTIPIETAKVRLQLQGGSGKYKGVFNTIKTIAAEEGTVQLWRGVVAGVHRHFGCAGFRIGLYVPIRDFWTPAGHEGPPSFFTKCMAAFTAGGIAMFIISPADVVKTRIQADNRGGGKPRYPSPTKAYGMIIKQEGVAALWTGIAPNATRNAVMNIFEVGMYDQAKEMLKHRAGMEEGVKLHIASAIFAAFTACVASSPLDVIKNRYITDRTGRYTSVAHCIKETLATDGFFCLYNGFLPFFMRASSFICVQFVAYEQIIKVLPKASQA
eukprot:TRINITY_DN101_c2_g1_i1.p1 TRINITY_DN101_c2_g1~~TRINITY_DN101_c2_g1_i1.p1  ORF type:complete len:292 (+),score=43.18 TRINITY_DN101_c2_g1_i1:50-925(+)